MTAIDVARDRLDRGLSQQALADEIGVTVDVIRQLERTGRRPHPANALRVASHYDLTVTQMWPEPPAKADAA